MRPRHFLINGPTTRRRVKRRRKVVRRAVALDRKKRKVYRSRRKAGRPISKHSSGRLPRRRHAKGVTMARRRRRRRHVARAATPRRRRVVHRRRRAIVAAAPRRRRRYRSNPVARRSRRRYRRNPSILGGGLGRAVMDGVKDGAVVFGGMVAQRKISAGLNAMIPATVAQSSPGLRGVIAKGLGAVVTTLAARKLTPKYASLVAAGAFADMIQSAVALNPTASSFLSAYSRQVLPRVNAYPQGALPAGGRVNGYVHAMPIIGLPQNV